MRYRRCPTCESSNPVDSSTCSACGAEVEALARAAAVEADTPAASSPIQNWDLALPKVLHDSLGLFVRTLTSLLAISLTMLGGAVLLTLGIGLLGGLLGPLFPIVLTLGGGPGVALILGFGVSTYVMYLADLCRGRQPGLRDLMAGGFVRGVGLAWSLMLFAGLLAAVMVLGWLTKTRWPLALMALWMLWLWVAAFPICPILILEVRTPQEALRRALSLTRGWRGSSLLLAVAQGTVLALGWWFFGAFYQIASAAGDLVQATLILALAFLLAALLAGVAGVLAFVFYWKATHGRDTAFLD